MDITYHFLYILFLLRKAHCSENDKVRIKFSQLENNGSERLREKQEIWQTYEKNIPLGLMLSKRETQHNKRESKNRKELTPAIKKTSGKHYHLKSDDKTIYSKESYKNTFADIMRLHHLTSQKKSECLYCCCCKRRLSKKKLKKVMYLLQEAMKTFDDPPPKPKPLAPPCDLGTCCMPCTQASCGCCCPCTQKVKVKYHPPQFEFEAMKGALMCGCGFGNPCGGCLMRSGK